MSMCVRMYSYLDYVEVIGSLHLQGAMLEGKPIWRGRHTSSSARVVYVPRQDVTGEDSFAYQATDCMGDLLRMSSPGVLTFSIAPINDAPRQLTHRVDVSMRAVTRLDFSTIVSDVETAIDKLTITITSCGTFIEPHLKQ